MTGLLKQMVCICKWSFGQVPLYILPIYVLIVNHFNSDDDNEL